MIPAKVCRWYGGKKAALSLRFDDSNTTHVEKAVPMLNEYGLIGTFLVNPGNDSYKKHQSAWEGPVIEKGHELGDHTWNHRGASTDQEAEEQVGGCAEYLRRVQPEPKLRTFVMGGRTLWMQRKPMDFLLAKYGLANSSRRSMSCSEDYPSFSYDAFRRRVDEGIANGDDIQFHFHPIRPEPGNLHISEPVFCQCLEYVHARRDDLWQAGMSAINQYEAERNSSLLQAYAIGDDVLGMRFACGADPEWFTQPVTLQVSLPPRVRKVEVRDAKGKPVEARVEAEGKQRVVRFDVKPVDAAYTVRATGLGAAYLKDNGPDLVAPGPHPYLFFDKTDVSALLQKAGAGTPKAIWERIKEEADQIAQTPVEKTEERRWGQSWRVRLMAFAYAMTGNHDYVAPAVAGIEATVSSDRWWTPNSEMLVTAETICTLALAYDWMYDALTPELRAKMRTAIVEHGIKPILEDTRQKEWYTIWYRCNWGGVIFGQAGVAALALLADEPQAAEWARLFIEKTWHYPQTIDREGGWGESGGYASYLWFRVVLLADALEHVTHGKMDMFAGSKLELLPQWVIHLMEPDEESFIPFADCHQGTSGAAPILYRLASEYKDGHAQWFAERMTERSESRDLFGLLWYDPTAPSTPPSDLPTAKVFPDISWGILRSRWDDPKATMFALKGGQKDWDHNHHDTNHFVLYAYGRPLIIDLLYPHKIWGCETESHNTIMVNDKDQRGHVRVTGGRGKPDHRGVVGDLFNVPWYAHVVGDASLAYEQDEVKSFVREVMYLRHASDEAPPDYFVMFDDVDCAAPSKVDWLLHTYGDLKVDGNRVTIAQDEAAADVTMLAPEKLEHELCQKSFEEAGSDKPFESAEAVKFVKLRPAQRVQRSRFLSVIAPRPASVASDANLTVAPVNGANTLGARMSRGSVEDVALFALDQPKMEGGGLSAVGRSCFVRRSGGGVTAAALHDGESLTLNGAVLFETDSSSNAVISWGKDAIEAQLDIFDCRYLRIHADRKPSKVLANGREREFEYEPENRCVKLTGYMNARDVKIVY